MGSGQFVCKKRSIINNKNNIIINIYMYLQIVEDMAESVVLIHICFIVIW